MIGLTTGRMTNQRLNSLIKEFAHSIPSAEIIRRGKSSREELASRFHEERLSHVITMYRRHGGPGRLDLHAVKSDGNSILILSALVKSVRLAGEYPNRSKRMATAITHDENVADETRRFCHALSTVLELPEIGASECSRIRTSIHVNELPDRTVQLAVTSPAARHEVGPKLLISKLLWGQND